MTEDQEAQLIAACDAVNDDAEINQLMEDWECTMADGIDELEQKRQPAEGRSPQYSENLRRFCGADAGRI